MTHASPEVGRCLLSRGEGASRWLKGTALHKAAAKGNVGLAALLLDNGAGLRVQDPLGRTPVVRAREEGQEEMVRFLESWE